MAIISPDIFIGFITLFCGAAILINGATLIAIVACRSLRKTQNIFTFNIALGDFVSSFVVAFQRLFSYWGDTYLMILTRVYGAAMMVAILSTLGVALHRFIIIRLDPFQNRGLVTAPRCILVCLLIWILVYAGYLGTFLINDNLFFYMITPNMLFFALIISAVVYGLVYCTISASGTHAGLTSEAYLLRVKKNKKVLCTFLLVVLSNLACWLLMSFVMFCMYLKPMFALQYYPQFGRYSYAVWLYNLHRVAYWIMLSNAIINPVIYWTRLTDFKQLIFGCCGRRDLKVSSPVTENSTVESENGNNLKKFNTEVNQVIINDKKNGSI